MVSTNQFNLKVMTNKSLEKWASTKGPEMISLGLAYLVIRVRGYQT